MAYNPGYDPAAIATANPRKRIGELVNDEAMLGRIGLLQTVAGGGFLPGQRAQMETDLNRQLGLRTATERALLNRRLAATPGLQDSAFGDAAYQGLLVGQQNALANYLAAMDEAGMERQYGALGQLFGSERESGARRGALRQAKLGVLSGGFNQLGQAAGAAIASSIDFKKDVRPADTKSLLDIVKNLDVKNFKYKGENEDQVGLIAEESPEMMKAGDKHLDLVKVVGVLLGAVQELAKKRGGEIYG